MAFPFLSEYNVEQGDKGHFDSESDSTGRLDFAHYSTLAQTPAPRPKRTLTPEQRAAAAANMAKARAARKLNLEKPSTAQVEQPQPTPVVEEVTE